MDSKGIVYTGEVFQGERVQRFLAVKWGRAFDSGDRLGPFGSLPPFNDGIPPGLEAIL